MFALHPFFFAPYSLPPRPKYHYHSRTKDMAKNCCRLVLFALASILLTTSSYAIRVPRDPNPTPNKVSTDEKISISTCKDSEACSSSPSSGNLRKLMNSSPSASPTTTNPKRVDKEAVNVKKSESFPAAMSESTEYGDITEMDYSPAKRKPPIHN